MQTVLLKAPRQIEIGEVEKPQPRNDEVLLRIQHVGLCGTDVHLFLGHREPPGYPFTPGHEILGVVESIGRGVTSLSVGQRVVLEPNYPCGACALCRGGRGNICPNKQIVGINLPGCLSHYAAAPAEFVWPLPAEIAAEDAVTIEPMAVSLHALMTSRARPGDSIAVIGLGAIGLLLTHLAAQTGLRVFATERTAAKLDLASQLGAHELDLAEGDDLGRRLATRWERAGVTSVFECAGAPTTTNLALEAAPRGAEVVLVGLSEKPASFIPLQVVRRGISIVGSMIYDHPIDFRRTIGLIADGVIHPGRIVAERFPLAQAAAAFQRAATGGVAKIVVDVSWK